MTTFDIELQNRCCVIRCTLHRFTTHYNMWDRAMCCKLPCLSRNTTHIVLEINLKYNTLKRNLTSSSAGCFVFLSNEHVRGIVGLAGHVVRSVRIEVGCASCSANTSGSQCVARRRVVIQLLQPTLDSEHGRVHERAVCIHKWCVQLCM